MMAATTMASSQQQDEEDRDADPLFSSVTAIENFVETAGSLLTSSLLLLVQDTSRPLLQLLLLGVLVQAWIAIDYYLRLAISFLPKSYTDWADVFKKISRFIAFSLIFLFVNYGIQAVNIEGSAGRLNVAETGVLIVILLVLAYVRPANSHLRILQVLVYIRIQLVAALRSPLSRRSATHQTLYTGAGTAF